MLFLLLRCAFLWVLCKLVVVMAVVVANRSNFFLQLLLTWSKKLFNKEQNSHLLLFGYAKRDKWSLKRTDEQAMANLGERMFNGQTN